MFCLSGKRLTNENQIEVCMDLGHSHPDQVLIRQLVRPEEKIYFVRISLDDSRSLLYDEAFNVFWVEIVEIVHTEDRLQGSYLIFE